MRPWAPAVIAAICCAAPAAAQEPPYVIGTLSETAPRTRPDAGSLKPVVLTYIATLDDGLTIRSLGERTVQLGRGIYAGYSAWEIVETRGAGANASVDSLVADFLTLKPYHWGAMHPAAGAGGVPIVAARVAAEFRSDTMIGAMQAPGGRKSMIVPVPGEAYVTAAHFEIALRGLPLQSGWRDSTVLVASTFGHAETLQASIAVVGEQQLLTTAGTFDAWIVSLSTAAGQTTYWVSKTDRIVVQSEQVVPETGAILKYQLSRISH